MDTSVYRTAAEREAIVPAPRWPIVRAAAVRLGAVFGILCGLAATACLIVIGPAARVIWFPQGIVCVLLLLNKAVPMSEDSWWSQRSWPQTLLLIAWAPLVLPPLGLYRLGVWILRGT